MWCRATIAPRQGEQILDPSRAPKIRRGKRKRTTARAEGLKRKCTGEQHEEEGRSKLEAEEKQSRGEAGAEQKIVVRRFRGKDSSRGAVNLGKK